MKSDEIRQLMVDELSRLECIKHPDLTTRLAIASLEGVIADLDNLQSTHEDRGVRDPGSPGEQEVSG